MSLDISPKAITSNLISTAAQEDFGHSTSAVAGLNSNILPSDHDFPAMSPKMKRVFSRYATNEFQLRLLAI